MRCLLVVLSIAVFVLAAGCRGPDYMLVGSAQAPNAEGEVEVEKADNGQWLVTAVLENAPAPTRFGEDKTTYVLWLGTIGEKPENKGAVSYDAKTRIARGMGTTARGLVELTITAEASVDVVAPSDIVIASRRISED